MIKKLVLLLMTFLMVTETCFAFSRITEQHPEHTLENVPPACIDIMELRHSPASDATISEMEYWLRRVPSKGKTKSKIDIYHPKPYRHPLHKRKYKTIPGSEIIIHK